ncbi:hypothetical protein CSUI_001138, partial [Cystoisospora suis]
MGLCRYGEVVDCPFDGLPERVAYGQSVRYIVFHARMQMHLQGDHYICAVREG